MRSLSAGQWDRYFELLEQLEKLPDEQRQDALLAQCAEGEATDILSLVQLRLGLAPDSDRCRTGERIRNFVLGEQIGRGGMGIVYRAIQEFPGGIKREVAVKLIHPEFVADAPGEARQRFQQEIGMLVMLEHKGIARIYDGGIQVDKTSREETLFFAMELVPGKPLNDYVAEHRATLGVSGILHVFGQVCDALSYVHQQGVIHRDLKPSNILVDVNAEPRIIDFGLAQCDGRAVAKIAIERRSGTLEYMSPEQSTCGLEPVTTASDIYALGVILYELLAGHHPRKLRSESSSAAMGSEGFRALLECLTSSCCGCAGELVRTVAQAMAPRPGDRFATTAELGHAVRRCLDAVQRQQQRSFACRRFLMKKVEEFWIDGVLRNSLHTMALMELGLTLRPDAIERPWDLIVQTPHRGPSTLPPGMKISEIFRDLGEAMLILGAPGAGKTTLLLELAQQLLSRAQQDDTQRVPVVFHLSTWAEQQLPLVEWLSSELEERYELPLRAARNCLKSNQILLLLDGLDEVVPIRRDRCVTAINNFRTEHSSAPLVVCSRTADYAALSVRLRLTGAVMIQSLTRRKISAYLERAGASLEGVRLALSHDEQLWDLLKTPLMLSITVLVYQRCPRAVLQPAVTLAERRTQLFAAYTNAMFKRRGKDSPYTRDEAMRWLAWLASSMLQRHQSVFYLEWMQPDWLLRPMQRWAVSVGSVVLCGLMVGVVAGLNDGLGGDLAFSNWQLLAWGLGGGLAVGVLGYGDKIKPVTRLRWSWSALREGLARKLFLAIGCGLIVSMGLALMLDEKIGIAIGLATAVAFCYFGGIDLDLKTTDLGYLTLPNGAIQRSLRNALGGGIAGLFAGAVLGGLVGGWNGVWLGASVFGLIVALTFGGFPCMQHYILRWLLWRNGIVPWRYVRFLDYMVERILLHRVGGGYAFIHRALLEYFARNESTVVEYKTNSH